MGQGGFLKSYGRFLWPRSVNLPKPVIAFRVWPPKNLLPKKPFAPVAAKPRISSVVVVISVTEKFHKALNN